jgi:uncharacterized protein
MNIQHHATESKGEYYIQEADEKLAEMTYSRSGEKVIIIDHTYVSDKLRGQGVGKKLVEQAVSMARENHLKIIPLCPFAKAIIQKTPEFQDVVNNSI